MLDPATIARPIPFEIVNLTHSMSEKSYEMNLFKQSSLKMKNFNGAPWATFFPAIDPFANPKILMIDIIRHII